MKPPLCRYCGKPIKKRTAIVYFGGAGQFASGLPRCTVRPDQFPTSKPEVEKLTNQIVLSISWARTNRRDYYAIKAGHDFIDKATTWDGESYERSFFCKDACAQNFGIVAARDHALGTETYWAALKKQG